MTEKERKVISSRGTIWREQGTSGATCIVWYKKEIFHSEKNSPLEQPPQGHGGIFITEGFQDTTGQDAKETLLGSLIH